MLLFVICLAFGMVAATEKRPYYDLDNAEMLFEDFILTYDKKYSDSLEKQQRFKIFMDNLIQINNKNSDNLAIYAINHFSDLTSEEFIQKHTGFNPSYVMGNACKKITDADVISKDAPPSINWVEKGAVTPPKSQESCGACWAFATVGNIEGQHFIKTNKLVSFSEQELVDCSKNNFGCSGGDMPVALSDLIEIGGLETESNYPFTYEDQSCKYDSTKAETKITGCTNYLLKDEEKLKEVLAKKGPIVIGVNGYAVMSYHGGILTKDHCSEDSLGHAVLLVGYGTEKGDDYWLVKNSWGDHWGLSGYFKIHRGDNTCGIVSGDSNCSADM